MYLRKQLSNGPFSYTSGGDLKQFYNAIDSRTVKIVFVGHSVVEGINAQMESENIWVEEFLRKLNSKFPTVTFNHVNFGLDSRTLAMFDDPTFVGVGSPDPGDGTGFYRTTGTYSWQTPSTIGKSWIDHLKDESPDLVVMEFGLNSGLSEANFQTSLESVITKIKAWTKVPSISILTELLPTINSDPYLDKNGLIKRYNEVIRTVCESKDCRLIDVARYWQLLRDGQDPLLQREQLITLDNLTQIVGGTAADTLTFNRMEETTNSVIYATETDEHRVVNMTCDYIPKSTSSIVQMGVRFNDALNEVWSHGVAIQVKNAAIVFYENGVVTQNTAHAVITPTNTHAVEIDVAIDTITVTIDTVVIATYTIASKFDHGNLAFGVLDADAQNVNLISLDMMPVVETAKYTNNELVGNKTAANWNSGDKRDGGNSINHPSRIGLTETFYKAIADFVSSINL